ncbi:MAG TPA: hemolysin family protein [Phycisphaerae bacterium]|nr:hemolysin family protein [Phycisphaerae bacterium]
MDDPLLWVAVASAALSGFFSLNAYALRDTSRRKLEAAFAGRPDGRLRGLLKHRSALHMLCGFLRTASNLALLVGVLGALQIHQGRTEIWRIIAAVGVTAGVVAIVSVAIPHAWSRYAGASVLAVTAPVLLALRAALLPLVMVMRAFDLPIRRLAGVPDPESDDAGENGGARNGSARETAVKAEILQVASDGQAEGAVDAAEMEMIESVIEFGDQRAGEIMTPRTDIVALPVDADGEQVRRTVVEAGHTRIPVYDGDVDHIVGVLYAKDLLNVPDPTQADLRRIMRKPFFIPDTKLLDELLREFKARKSHMAIVLDEYGGTAGLVTVEDVIEEIMGDISDEYDRPESALMRRLDDRSVEVDGRMYIDDLNDALGLSVPEEEDYDTVAGFVSSELGAIGQEGETLTACGAVFTILAADDRKIHRLRVERVAEPDAAKS